ncbi:LysR family transcriptional regulator [Clostridium oceanicum]|uniref:LysR family transcriptional regulator n=1 Tax=Clostridium oceanicum TaxID=1543 RepID=A0ABN1JFL0_9CLOT
MDLKYFITLKTILQEGSFQKAASKLSYTQSTVTSQIKSLEAELGVKLFEKIGRNMVLTQAGKDVLPQIDVVVESVNKIKNYGKSNKELGGKLKIAIAESLLSYKMQDVLKEFKLMAPKVELTFTSVNCYILQNAIIYGDIDIGVYYDIGKHNSVTTDKLGAFSLALVCSPDLNMDKRDFITPNQNKDLTLIGLEKQSINREIFEKYMKDKNINLNNIIELYSIETIKKSVAGNLGVAYLPRFTVKDELKKGALVELETSIPNKKITAQCVYHKNKWLSPAMKLFIKLVKSTLNKSE